MVSSFGCLLLAVPDCGIWDIGCKLLSFAGGGNLWRTCPGLPRTAIDRQVLAIRHSCLIFGLSPARFCWSISLLFTTWSLPLFCFQRIPTIPELQIADGTALLFLPHRRSAWGELDHSSAYAEGIKRLSGVACKDCQGGLQMFFELPVMKKL